MQDKKIKRIEYYNFNGKFELSKAEEIFKTKAGLNKVEYFDTLGNLVKENGFDKAMTEDHIIDYKYDSNSQLTERMTYKNYYNQPQTKDYMYRYIYQGKLLTEILWYFRTFDSSGYTAKNRISYNEKNQKIKDEFIEVENGITETRIFNWQDQFSYTENRFDKENKIAEKHFVRLNNQGNEIEHRMNFEPSSNGDTSFPIHFEYTFDQFGNELTRTKKMDGKPVQNTEYEYQYENANWNYRVFYSNKNVMWTQIRKIEYYSAAAGLPLTP